MVGEPGSEVVGEVEPEEPPKPEVEDPEFIVQPEEPEVEDPELMVEPGQPEEAEVGEPGPPGEEEDEFEGEDTFEWPYAPGPDEYKSAGREMEVFGVVRFNVPTGKLPPNSCLRIKLVDASRMDAAYTIIVSQTYELGGQDPGNAFPYELVAPKPARNELWRFYQLSTVLNVGWCKKPDSSEWIRQGDYNNVWSHNIQMTAQDDSYEKDINIVKYIRRG